MKRDLSPLLRHQGGLAGCRSCPKMIPPVIVPPPVLSPIYLVGQAPGSREGVLGRPFAWTAGRRLFEWFGGLGVDETTFRDRVYIAAVCRCFPGKTTGGGDRAPDALEIQNCSRWMADELTILRPKLVLTVGKLATERFLGKGELVGWIGASHDGAALGWKGEVIPLPHPSGASSWWKVEPGKTLTRKALGRIGKHPVWRAVFSRR